MKRNIVLIAMMFAASFLFTACEKDDPVVPNEEELITTLNYSLTPTDGGAAIILSFKDLDGDGGSAPTITGGTLVSGQAYICSLELFNETESPATNITTEIIAEDEDHQFFFQSDIADLAITYNDQDSNGNPIGVESLITAGAASSGSLTITLRHEPNKSGENVASGNIANAGGETDIEVTFPLDVQ